jgi:FkbM family methyltransferase
MIQSMESLAELKISIGNRYIYHMLISVFELFHHWGVNPTQVVHVGAHEAEEESSYSELGWNKSNKIIWIEANPNLSFKLENRLNTDTNYVVHAAVWSSSGESITLKITNKTQSSSLLDFGTHSSLYPNIKVESEFRLLTKTLNEILENVSQVDFLNLDIQGAELQALKGFEKRLNSVKWIYTEVSKKQIYKGCATVSEMDLFLTPFGFSRVSTRWMPLAGWGDALYVQDKYLNSSFCLSCKRNFSKIIWLLSNCFYPVRLALIKIKNFRNLSER